MNFWKILKIWLANYFITKRIKTVLFNSILNVILKLPFQTQSYQHYWTLSPAKQVMQKQKNTRNIRLKTTTYE